MTEDFDDYHIAMVVFVKYKIGIVDEGESHNSVSWMS